MPYGQSGTISGFPVFIDVLHFEAAALSHADDCKPSILSQDLTWKASLRNPAVTIVMLKNSARLPRFCAYATLWLKQRRYCATSISLLTNAPRRRPLGTCKRY